MGYERFSKPTSLSAYEQIITIMLISSISLPIDTLSVFYTTAEVRVWVGYYNMTVWILARNDINFSMAAGLIRLHICPASSNLVCNEGQRVSPYSPRQSLALLMEVSTNYCCQKQRHNFHSSSQIRCEYVYCGRVAFTVFKHADIKGVRQCLTSTASLDDGYCEATIPVVMGHHVT